LKRNTNGIWRGGKKFITPHAKEKVVFGGSFDLREERPYFPRERRLPSGKRSAWGGGRRVRVGGPSGGKDQGGWWRPMPSTKKIVPLPKKEIKKKGALRGVPQEMTGTLRPASLERNSPSGTKKRRCSFPGRNGNDRRKRRRTPATEGEGPHGLNTMGDGKAWRTTASGKE